MEELFEPETEQEPQGTETLAQRAERAAAARRAAAQGGGTLIDRAKRAAEARRLRSIPVAPTDAEPEAPTAETPGAIAAAAAHTKKYGRAPMTVATTPAEGPEARRLRTQGGDLRIEQLGVRGDSTDVRVLDEHKPFVGEKDGVMTVPTNTIQQPLPEAHVTVGRPAVGIEQQIEGMSEAELKRLANDPKLATRIEARLAMVRKRAPGVKIPAAPPTFAEVAGHTLLNYIASPFIGGIADVDTEDKLRRYAEGGGKLDEDQINMLAAIGAGGAVAGNVAVGQGLGAGGGIGVGGAEAAAARLGMKKGSEAMRAGAQKAIADVAAENRVHPSRVAKLLTGAGDAVRARAPQLKDAALSGAAQAAGGATLTGATAVAQGERDPAELAKAMGESALQFGIMGAGFHALSTEAQFQSGYELMKRSIDRVPAIKEQLASERMKRTGGEPGEEFGPSGELVPRPKPGSGGGVGTPPRESAIDRRKREMAEEKRAFEAKAVETMFEAQAARAARGEKVPGFGQSPREPEPAVSPPRPLEPRGEPGLTRVATPPDMGSSVPPDDRITIGEPVPPEGKRFPATAIALKDFAAEKGISIDEAAVRMKAANYDVPDHIVAAAGGTAKGPVADLSPNEVRSIVNVNEFGQFARDYAEKKGIPQEDAERTIVSMYRDMLKSGMSPKEAKSEVGAEFKAIIDELETKEPPSKQEAKTEEAPVSAAAPTPSEVEKGATKPLTINPDSRYGAEEGNEQVLHDSGVKQARSHYRDAQELKAMLESGKGPSGRALTPKQRQEATAEHNRSMRLYLGTLDELGMAFGEDVAEKARRTIEPGRTDASTVHPDEQQAAEQVTPEHQRLIDQKFYYKGGKAKLAKIPAEKLPALGKLLAEQRARDEAQSDKLDKDRLEWYEGVKENHALANRIAAITGDPETPIDIPPAELKSIYGTHSTRDLKKLHEEVSGYEDQAAAKRHLDAIEANLTERGETDFKPKAKRIGAKKVAPAPTDDDIDDIPEPPKPKAKRIGKKPKVEIPEGWEVVAQPQGEGYPDQYKIKAPDGTLSPLDTWGERARAEKSLPDFIPGGQFHGRMKPRPAREPEPDDETPSAAERIEAVEKKIAETSDPATIRELQKERDSADIAARDEKVVARTKSLEPLEPGKVSPASYVGNITADDSKYVTDAAVLVVRSAIGEPSVLEKLLRRGKAKDVKDRRIDESIVDNLWTTTVGKADKPAVILGVLRESGVKTAPNLAYVATADGALGGFNAEKLAMAMEASGANHLQMKTSDGGHYPLLALYRGDTPVGLVIGVSPTAMPDLDEETVRAMVDEAPPGAKREPSTEPPAAAPKVPRIGAKKQQHGTFAQEYEKELRAEFEKDPTQFGYKADEIPRIVEKLSKQMAEDPGKINYRSSKALKRVAKTFGVPFTKEGLKQAANMDAQVTSPEKAVEQKAEDVTTGATDAEVKDVAQAFTEAQETQESGDRQVTHVFDPPARKEIVRIQDKVKVYVAEHGWMTVKEARARLAEWKAHAKAQGKTSANRERVVLSLFDRTGEWSKPWEEAGYQVYRFDIQDDWFYEEEDPETGEVVQKRAGDVMNFSAAFFNDMFGAFEGNDVHAVLAACPCTDFAVSGARHFAAKDADGQTVASVALVNMTQAAIEFFKPAVWALENPVGRIEKLTGLPPWRVSFDPNHFGDPYTKKTLLWGRFNGDMPIAPVEPTEGSKMHTQYGGKSERTKNARSVTPEGFAYAFFMANNAMDHMAMAIANKYDRLDRGAIEDAVRRGVTEREISDAVDDFYYMELDDASANKAIRELRPETSKEEKPAAEKSEHDYSSTQINLPPGPASKIERIAAEIPDADLADEGREKEPHITVKFGLHGNDPDAVRALLAKEPPIKVSFGKTSLFQNDEADVVKVDVDSADLHRLNKLIADALPNTDTHPEYKPHATVAYVKPGLGKKYAGNPIMQGDSFTIKEIVFSGQDGTKTVIPLGGKRIGIPQIPAMAGFTPMGAKPIGEPVAVVEAPGSVPKIGAKGERVAAAAIKTPDGQVFTAPLHVQAYADAIRAGAYPDFQSESSKERAIRESRFGSLPFSGTIDGFVTSTGRFVSRREAQNIAQEQDQLSYGSGRNTAAAEEFKPGELLAVETPKTPKIGSKNVQNLTAEAETPASVEDIGKLMKAGVDAIKSNSFPTGSKAVRDWAEKVLGRPFSSGTWHVDDVYDALEGTANEWMRTVNGGIGQRHSLERFKSLLAAAMEMEMKLFTGRLRSAGVMEKAQFSTPLPLSVGAAWALNAQGGEKVLEPTAGTGNLITPLANSGVTIRANELDPRRVAVLKALGFEDVTSVDALTIQLDGTRVNGVLMNPPFGSHATGKYSGQGALPFKDSDIAQRFVYAALNSLVDGGRLVAIMPMNTVGKSGRPFREWLEKEHTPILYLESPEGAYRGRGTETGTVMLVVDKGKTGLRKLPDMITSNAYGSAITWGVWRGTLEKFAGGEAYNRKTGHEPAVDVAAAKVRRLGSPKQAGIQEGDSGPSPELGSSPGRGVDEGSGAKPARRIGARTQPDESAGGPGDGVERGAERPAGVVAGQPSGPRAADVDDVAAADVVPQLPRGRTESRAGDSEERRSELAAANDSAVFAPYVGGIGQRRAPHPRLVVETRAMAGMPAPPITTKPQSLEVKNAWGRDGAKGGISDEQLDAILRTTTAWDKGHGMLVSDDVGVGKSREAAGAALEAIAQGAKRILYITKNETNLIDAQREFRAVASGSEDGDFPAMFVTVGDYPRVKKGEDSLPMPDNRPVIYLAHSYNFREFADALLETNLDTLLADEAHEFKNLFADRGMAWQALHAQMLERPDSRFAYFTATPGVSLDELGYLFGLREWPVGGFSDWVDRKLGFKPAEEVKEDTKAADKAQIDERNKMRALGEAGMDALAADDTDIKKGKRRFMRGAPDVFAMKVTPAETEQVMRELKGSGKYISRDLWRGGVKFDVDTNDLLGSGEEAVAARERYDQAAELVRDLTIAAQKFGRMNQKVKTAGLDRALIQSYMKQLLFDLRFPKVLAVAKQALKDGKQVVISINTVAGDAPLEEGISAADAEVPLNKRLESAINRINTQEIRKEGQGDTAEFVDLGEIPEALLAVSELRDRLASLPPLRDPIRAIEDAFGKKNVAAITGKASAKKRKQLMAEFQAGQRSVAVISKAGKTGISLHDVNGNQRRMLVADYEWSADTFKQELGRVDRTGQRSNPEVTLMASNIAGERKFAATIAARMASLGATSKGSAEATGTDALDQFDVADSISLAAMKQTIEQLFGSPLRDYLTGSKWYEWRKSEETRQWERFPKRRPDEVSIRDFLLDLMMFPVKAADEVWAMWNVNRDALISGESTQAAASKRTGRLQGEITRTTDLSKKGEPQLTLYEVKNAEGERRGILQGFVTHYINRIQGARGADEHGATKSRRYIQFTAPTGLVSGLELTPGEVRRVKEDFGRADRTTITPDAAWEDLNAGERVKVNGPDNVEWTLRQRQDGKIAIEGATLAKHGKMLNGIAQFATVGNLLYVPGDRAAFEKFIARYPLKQPDRATKGRSDATKAPSGATKPAPDATNPAQTETAAFKNWFGKSKVVDASGKPLVVYHGTQADFDEFNQDNARSVSSEDQGYFFTSDPEEASAHAKHDWGRDNPQPNVMPVYLSISNPEIVENVGQPARWYDTHGAKAVARAMADGRDGLIIGSDEGKIYVAFRNTQIKSATANRGTFDGGSGNILYSVADPFSAIVASIVELRKIADRRAKAGRTPLATSSIDEVTERMASARGVSRPRLRDQAKEALEALSKLTRHFPEIDPSRSPLEATIHETLLEQERAPKWAQAKAYNELSRITDGLEPNEVDLMADILALRDIVKDVERGLYRGKDELPFGYPDVDAVKEDLSAFEAKATPTINAAIEKRQAFVRELTEELVAFDLLDAKTLDDDRYYHRQVMAYFQPGGEGKHVPFIGGKGKEVRQRGRGFQKGRVGGTDFNLRYEQAEFEWVAQALQELKTAATLETVKHLADISKSLKTQAKLHNMRTLGEKLARSMGMDPERMGAEVAEQELAPFRQRIGRAISGILAALEDVDISGSLGDSIDDLMQRHEDWKSADTGGRFPLGSRWWQIVAALAEGEHGSATVWARSLFKAIADKESFIKTTLGKDYINPRNPKALAELAPAGYTTWQPEVGNHFFRATGIEDRAVQAILSSDRKLDRADLQELMVMGGAKETWIVPEWLAASLSHFGVQPTVPGPLGAIDRALVRITGLWKQYILHAPTRTIKYNLNNFSGDVDAALAYGPAILKGIPDAAKTLWHQQFKRTAPEGMTRKELDAETERLVELGVIDAGITANEIPDITDLPAFQRLAESDPITFMGILQTYFKWTRELSQYRENILRLAAYRYFEKRILAGETIYAGSNPDRVRAETDPRRRAALLARDLIGDYGATSAFTQFVRQRMLPFFSFQEVNFKRYMRLLRNLPLEAGQKERAGWIAGTLTLKGGKQAAKLALLANLFFLAAALWNATMYPDEEEELRRRGRQGLHVILGRYSDGSVRSMRIEGAFGALLEWIGLRDYPEDIRDLMTGDADLGDKAMDAIKAPVNRVVQLWEPFTKMVGEQLTKKSTYPDAFRPTPIRDRGEHAARLLALDNLYRNVTGKPSPPGNWVDRTFFYRTDPGEAAYFDMKSRVAKYLDEHDKPRSSAEPTEKGNALYYWKRSVQWGDSAAAKKWEGEYRRLGGTGRGMKQSISMSEPLGGISKKDRGQFRAQLTPAERDVLDMANTWYNRIYRPKRIGAQPDSTQQ